MVPESGISPEPAIASVFHIAYSPGVSALLLSRKVGCGSSPAQLGSAGWAETPPPSRCPPQLHTCCSQLFSHTLQREIPSGPLVRRVQICCLPISPHISPTGSNLGRTRAALGVMNHHSIFLGHMRVKLLDINHARAAPV